MLVQRDTDQFAMGAGVSQLASPFRGFDGEQQSLNEWEEADEWTSEADLEEALEDEWEGDTEFEEEAAWQSGTESETAVEDTEAEAEAFRGGRDASLLALAERIAGAGRAAGIQQEAPKKRWTTCFTQADIDRLRVPYQENVAAAAAGGMTHRCSCIVMLNVGLGQLLTLRLKESVARGKSSRKVQMGALTTETIELAMAQLQARGYALRPIEFDFFDRRKKRAGTLKPEMLKSSVSAGVLARCRSTKCWYAFGLSLMAGYHSVLLLVDRTGANATIYWLDQYSPDVTDDVTTSLDERITTKTQTYWQGVKDEARHVGSDTTIRLWPLRKKL